MIYLPSQREAVLLLRLYIHVHCIYCHQISSSVHLLCAPEHLAGVVRTDVLQRFTQNSNNCWGY